MKRSGIVLVPLAVLLSSHLPVLGDSDRVYGKIVARDGRVFEGPIRWDRNEASWFDVLDGNKRLPRGNREASARAAGAPEEEPKREVRFLGIKILELDEDGGFPSSAQSGVRFGHVKSLEPLDGSRARLILHSGEEVVLRGSDFGSSVRGIVIEDEKEGKVELKWKEIEMVEFHRPSQRLESEFGQLLYGTLLTQDGAGFTGRICWDLDELFSRDVLDGDDEGQRRKIEFGEIEWIQRSSSSSARVFLKSGEEIRLSGTNDVNDDNRGILVMDPGIGQVRVGWDEFDKVIFEPAPEEMNLDFDGGRPLFGVVQTETGERIEGRVRWDNDEESTWEFLNGDYRGMEFSVELGLVQAIEKASKRSSIVTLKDGRSFELRGSNDVDSGNKGVFVTGEDGKEVMVSWRDFHRLDFRPPLLEKQTPP